MLEVLQHLLDDAQNVLRVCSGQLHHVCRLLGLWGRSWTDCGVGEDLQNRDYSGLCLRTAPQCAGQLQELIEQQTVTSMLLRWKAQEIIPACHDQTTELYALKKLNFALPIISITFESDTSLYFVYPKFQFVYLYFILCRDESKQVLPLRKVYVVVSSETWLCITAPSN